MRIVNARRRFTESPPHASSLTRGLTHQRIRRFHRPACCNRWYAPKLGQFLTEDPLGAIDSYNPYTYAAMDPINFWDPYGLAAQGTANIFDVSKQDPIGIVGLVRRGADGIEDLAATIGDSSRRATENARDFYYPGMHTCQGLRCLGFHAGALATEVYAQVAPQSQGDVLLDIALMMGLGAPKIARGAVAWKTRVCSFTAGTVVRMCDGSYQPIETVQAGQWVLARDASTGELACKEVVDPYANPDRSILVVELQAEDGTTEVLETTDNHPFYVADRGWTRVDELSIGDLIPSADSTMLTLVSALWTHRIETVYNFGVEGFHTYFVGESEAWVHNCKNIVRSIHKDPLLVREAESAGRSVQRSLDALQEQLAKGNMNPGSGTKSLGFGGVHEARATDGARVYFRNVDEQTVEILGKSSKQNQEKVISRLRRLYEN